jgi:hypothetical protein
VYDLHEADVGPDEAAQEPSGEYDEVLAAPEPELTP